MFGLPDGITACLLDLDGVLTKTAEVHARAWKQAFAASLKPRGAGRQAGRPGARPGRVRRSLQHGGEGARVAYYEGLTVRDSSLSACMQAIVAAEVGHLELAFD